MVGKSISGMDIRNVFIVGFGYNLVTSMSMNMSQEVNFSDLDQMSQAESEGF